MKRINKIAAMLAVTAVITASFAGCARSSESKTDSSADLNVTASTSDNANSPAESESATADTTKTDSDTTAPVESESEPSESESVETTETVATAEASVPERAPFTVKTLGNETAAEPVDANEPLPSVLEILDKAAEKLNAAESFVVEGHVEGRTPGNEKQYCVYENSYSGAYTPDVSYINTIFHFVDHSYSKEDEQTRTYEEYALKTGADDTAAYGMTMVFKDSDYNSDEWLGGHGYNNELVYMPFANETERCLNTTGPLCLFWKTYNWDISDETKRWESYDRTTSPVVATATAVRDSNGDIKVTLPDWSQGTSSPAEQWTNEDWAKEVVWNHDDKYAKYYNDVFSNVCKNNSADTHDIGRLSDDWLVGYTSTVGCLTYTFDSDYNLKMIESTLNDETDGTSLSLTLTYSNWNNVAPIEVPEYEEANMREYVKAVGSNIKYWK